MGNEGALTDYDKKAAEKFIVDGDFPKNSKGESYGTILLADFVGYMPDLTQEGDGFIRMDERQEQARKLDGLSKEECPHEYTYFLYDKEGEVIKEMKDTCQGHYEGMSMEEVQQAIMEGRLW